MDLLRSHKTKPVTKILKKNDVTLSLVPAGCTGIVQPVDISFNRPFKDMLKEEIDKAFEQADNNIDPDDITRPRNSPSCPAWPGSLLGRSRPGQGPHCPSPSWDRIWTDC